MIRSLIALGIFISWPMTATASWLDTIANRVDAALGNSASNNNAKLIPAVTTQYNLPAHWRSYWLDEPRFGTRIFLAETGKPNAPVILLVHGLGQNGLRDWLPIAPELEKYYRVIMIDLPGFANSPSPKAKLSPTAYADLLHYVKPYFSLTPIAVAGHSMGGAVTLRYAERYPEDITRILLIDAAGILQRTAFVKHSATDRIPLTSDTTPGPLLTYALGAQDLGNSLIEKMLRVPDPTSLLGKSEVIWGATLQSFPNINAALSLVEENFSTAIFEQQKPVSILWGSNDMIAPLRTGQLLAANLNNSTLQIVEGASHVPMASHPKEVSQWVLEQFNQPLTTTANTSSLTSSQNYDCNHNSGEKISGHYVRISIYECTGIMLDNVTADEVIIRDSVVAIYNSHFNNSQTALTINNSSTLITGGTITGIVNLDNSRIDFAGVSFSKETPFKVKQKSRLILSVSKAGKNRYLHQDIQLENITF